MCSSDLNSLPGNEFIAIASASGELRASVVIVKLAYSLYVKLIFWDTNKSISRVIVKKRINGINITIIVFTFSNNSSPLLANIQKTAKDKNNIWKFENELIILSFILPSSKNFVIWAATNGITITIKSEYASSAYCMLLLLEKNITRYIGNSIICKIRLIGKIDKLRLTSPLANFVNTKYQSVHGVS